MCSRQSPCCNIPESQATEKRFNQEKRIKQKAKTKKKREKKKQKQVCLPHINLTRNNCNKIIVNKS
jgi:hypothetical protein